MLWELPLLLLGYWACFFALCFIVAALSLNRVNALAVTVPKAAGFPGLSEVAWGRHTAQIRQLIWLYLVLWLIEGGLRRWFLPGLATPLLLIRDPVVILIYILAAGKNLFPSNSFVVGGAILGLLSFVNALLIGHGNAAVAAYGVRCDFLHVPLIFIIGQVLRQKDLLFLARMAVVLTIPYTALLVAQFYAPQDAWVNRGVGGEGGAGFDGALDRFRPPGTFSFITGPAILYPLLTAAWFLAFSGRSLPVWLLAASGAALVVGVPISISRSLFLGCSIVSVTGLAALFVGGRLSSKLLINLLIASALLPILITKVPAFRDGTEAFNSRWEAATDDQGGFQEAIVDRTIDGLTSPFKNVTATGLGTGFSTNVGQKMLTQERGFGASEGEWGRILFDNGSLLGVLIVIFRIALTGNIGLAAINAWKMRSPASLVFTSAAFLGVLNGQWGQATSLGGAIIGGGLTLAAANAFAPSATNASPIARIPNTRRRRDCRKPAKP